MKERLVSLAPLAALVLVGLPARAADAPPDVDGTKLLAAPAPRPAPWLAPPEDAPAATPTATPTPTTTPTTTPTPTPTPTPTTTTTTTTTPTPTTTAVLPLPGAPLKDAPLGWTAAVRFGFALPFGDAYEGAPFGGSLNGAFPLTGELLWPLGPRSEAGIYGSFGKVWLDTGGADVDVRVRSTRLGGIGTWRPGQETLAPIAGFSPVLSAALGFEYFSTHTGYGSSRFNGLEATLGLGGERAIEPGLWLGPFVQLGVGEFISVTYETEDDTDNIAVLAPHEWLSFGLRGRLEL